MRRMSVKLRFLIVILLAGISVCEAVDPPYYIKKQTWQESMWASQEALAKEEQTRGNGVRLNFAQDEFTVAGWVRTESEAALLFAKSPLNDPWARGSVVLSIRADGDTSYMLYSIRRADSFIEEPWFQERLWDKQNFALTSGLSKNVKIIDGKWHHVALTGRSEFQFYVDGKPIQTTKWWGWDKVTSDNPDHDIYLGQVSYEPYLVTGPKDDIDEFQIFDRRLSSAEVESLYRNPASVKSGLVGWWGFEDGAKDQSEGSGHGIAVGGHSIEGKFGKAWHLEEGAYLSLPTFPRQIMMDNMWTLLARDFTDDESIEQMRWEHEDKIWKDDLKPGDIKKLARRYTVASRDILDLSEKAGQLAADVKTNADLTGVRDIYYLSRLNHGKYEQVLTGLEKLIGKVDYLQEVHPEDDEKWNQYKESVSELGKNCKKSLAAIDAGDEEVIAKLSGLVVSLDELENRMPLRLPSGPPGTGKFGAVYQTLKFSSDWDKPWRISGDADVVVRFDEFDHRFVFWHGTSYIPCWATYDGAWYTNEFFERRGWLSGGDSMMEPMSDKQARYSHVRVIENNDARVVVHWRYTPADLNYKQGYIDPETGWGDWVDEYYTIYPDAIGVRKATLHSSGLNDWIEYQESIVINQPGTIPEDNIEFGAVALGNLEGESKTFVWSEEGGPSFDDAPENPCIQIVNFKNPHKPFFIVNPEGVTVRPYSGHAPGSHFNFWNHWPVAQAKSDGTVATSGDKPSHSSLSLAQWKVFSREEKKATWIMLNGMTDKSTPDLVPLANSWLTPPDLKIESSGYDGSEYDQTQRAYLLNCINDGSPRTLKINIAAKQKSPIENLGLVIKNWGASGANLQINGQDIGRGKDFRYGHRQRFQNHDLIIWIRMSSTKPVNITLSPTN